MDSDDESHDVKLRSKHYNALRTDIIAALSAFDRAQDWAVSCFFLPCIPYRAVLDLFADPSLLFVFIRT